MEDAHDENRPDFHTIDKQMTRLLNDTTRYSRPLATQPQMPSAQSNVPNSP